MIGQALAIMQLAAAQLPTTLPADQPAVQAPFDGAHVPEPVLAEQRGGIRLPNGIDVTLSIDTVTALDGRIVLQTVTRIDEGAPVVTAYAPEDGTSVALPERADVNTASAQPRITYNRQQGLTVSTGTASVPITVSSRTGGSEPQVAQGLRALDLTQSATTDSGVVQARGNNATQGVELQGMDIRVVHLTGNAIGSAIANMGSDRAIDTQTTLSIDLRNAGPDVLGSTMLRVEDVGIGALTSRF